MLALNLEARMEGNFERISLTSWHVLYFHCAI